MLLDVGLDRSVKRKQERCPCSRSQRLCSATKLVA
jgi:hypothetical protein